MLLLSGGSRRNARLTRFYHSRKIKITSSNMLTTFSDGKPLFFILALWNENNVSMIVI